MSSIAVVVLDTLRKDFFDEHFGWLPGIHFDYAWTTSHYTIPTHATMFTGKYASEIGVGAKGEYFDCPNSVLAEILSEHGYTTNSISANILLSPMNNFDRGFDKWQYIGRANSLRKEVFDWGEGEFGTEFGEGFTKFTNIVHKFLTGDSDIIPSLKFAYRLRTNNIHGSKEAVSFLKRHIPDSKEFLFINLMEAHGPYIAPEEYRCVDYDALDETREDYYDLIKIAYEDCVRFLSTIYERIFHILKEDFDYIITVSDHGELLGEYNKTGHWYGLYPELTHIPLCIYDGRDEVQTVDKPVSTIDVFKTILSLADIEGYQDRRGQALIDGPEPAYYLTEYHGLREGRIERLSREGKSKEIPMYENELTGLVAPPSYYGYETIEGFQSLGTYGEDDPIAEKNRILASMDSQEMTDETARYDDVRNQLRSLGYL